MKHSRLDSFLQASSAAAAQSELSGDWPALYARQRQAGFRMLRFIAPLEREYRDAFADLNFSRLIVLHAAGVLSLLAFLLFDRYAGGHHMPSSAAALLVLMALGLLTPLAVAATVWRVRAFQPCLIVGLLVANLALVALIAVTRNVDHHFPYESLMLVSFYGYFMSALPLRWATCCGVGALMVHISATVWAVPEMPHFWRYELYYLALANLFGMVGRYVTEYQERSLYLLQREHRYDAAHDPLTGVLNRRAFMRHAEQVWAMAARNQNPLGLALYDLDDFKRVNDMRGHAAGDDVLVVLARTLSTNARRALDGIGRIGGDEFVGLWSHCGEHEFHRLQSRIGEQLGQSEWGNPEPHSGIATSTGALWVPDARALTLSAALAQADKLLYSAKAAGKQRLSFATATVTAVTPASG